MKIISFLTFESGEGETVLWSTKPISDVYFLLLDGGDTMSGPNCKNSRKNSFKNYLFGIFRLHPSSFILGQRDAGRRKGIKKKCTRNEYLRHVNTNCEGKKKYNKSQPRIIIFGNCQYFGGILSGSEGNFRISFCIKKWSYVKTRIDYLTDIQQHFLNFQQRVVFEGYLL